MTGVGAGRRIGAGAVAVDGAAQPRATSCRDRIAAIT